MSVPLVLGSYIVQHTIGTGTFARVRLAQHQITKVKVAVKIINRARMQLLNQESKVRREIQLMQTLSHHPNIVKIIEIFDTPTDLFLVTEYLEGGELFDLIAKSRGRIQEQEARLYFQQLIAAVDFCHQNMVSHRDLKPENILLDGNQNIKLCDFGLGNFFRNGEVLLTPCGSPNYASPEVCSGKPYAGPEVDVWSCGVILYTLLTGSLPFDDDNMGALKNKICRGLYGIPGYLSESSSSLMRRMLDVDPFRRLTIPEVKRHRWFREKLPPYLFSGKWLKPIEDPDPEIIKQMLQLDYEITSYKALTAPTLYPTFQQLGYRLLSIAKPDKTPSVAKYLVQFNSRSKSPKPPNKEPNFEGFVFSAESRRHSKQRKIFEIDLAPFRPMAALNRFGSDSMLVASQNKTRNPRTPSLSTQKSSSSLQPSNTTQGASTQGSLRIPGPPSSVLSGSRHRGSSRDVVVPPPNWRLVNIFEGISSPDPTSVFLMILNTLRSINYEWFFLNPLKIRCRPIQPSDIPTSRILKIPILTIQLLKVEPERPGSPADDLLVLSVQVFGGATLLAFSESIRVLRKIQEAAQASHYFISPSRRPSIGAETPPP